MKHQIKTSVIGSYPIKIEAKDLMYKYFNGNEIIWKKYIEEAVNDMVCAGIDIISDGQTRDPFIQIFTRKLNGCRIRDRTEIVNKVEYIKPITVDDQIYTRNILPNNKENIGVLTGPFTLASSCVNQYYDNSKDLAYDFAYALSKEAENLQKCVDLISIDEPFYSNELPEYSKELIDIIIKKIHLPTRLHVCGDVSKIIPDLLDMPIDILSHEFKATTNLLNKFNEYSVSKKICLGSVRSDDTKVESVKDITNHIKYAYDLFGEKIVQISPDCGQRMLPRKIAFKKLQNLVKAGDIINGR